MSLVCWEWVMAWRFAGWRLGHLVEKYVLSYLRVLFLIALEAFHTLQWF